MPSYLLLFVVLLLRPSSAFSQSPTAYEVLESYDLPPGLLPVGALGYDLDPATGRFAARLPGTCGFSLDGSYQLRYSSTITGVISPGRIRSLQGVSVKILFFWISIIDISRSGDRLDFSVGITSAGFGIDNFFICPQCGCGVNCNSIGGRIDDAGEEPRSDA